MSKLGTTNYSCAKYNNNDQSQCQGTVMKEMYVKRSMYSQMQTFKNYWGGGGKHD